MVIAPMLGVNLADYSEKILDGKFWRMSEKVDGVRRLFYKNPDGKVTAISRTNHNDPWLTHIFEFLKRENFPKNTVYDCEIVDRYLYFRDDVPSFVLRQSSSAKASQQYADNKQDLMAICFDIFSPNGDMRTGRERDELLYKIFQNSTDNDPLIRVPIFGMVEGADTDLIGRTMSRVEARYGEGIMLLNMDSIYIPGRTKELVKIKRMQEFIGKIIDVEMARPGTKIEGMVAAVICDVPGCTVPVRVGSGFDNQERLDMAISSPIGRYIEIDAFSYSKNAKGFVSLNLPVFKAFKNDMEVS